MPSGAAAAQAIATAVAHSLWLGALVAAWSWASSLLLRQAQPRQRYWAAMAALALLLVSSSIVLLLGHRFRGDWTTWVAAVWAAGAFTMMVRVGNSWRRVKALRDTTEAADRHLQALVRDEAVHLGIRAEISVRLSAVIDVPCTLGLWQPELLVPVGLVDQLDERHARVLIAHELAHVARYDFALNLLQTIVEGLFFYHPATALLGRAVRQERERCCDEIVRAQGRAEDLAAALAVLEGLREAPISRGGRITSDSLLERVRALVTSSPAFAPWQLHAWRTAVALLAVAGLASVFAALWATGTAAVPSPGAWLALAAAAGLGVMVGLRHAFEPDHLVAVATMVQHERNGRSAARLGASWGVGHTLSLFAIGAGLTLARRAMPQTAAVAFEAAVSVMVVAIGVRAVYLGWRLGSEGPQVRHQHGALIHAHAAASPHIHLGPVTLARQPLLVGVVHGLAGSGALTALALASLSSLSAQLTFILLFGLGSMAGMAAIAGLAGWPLTRFVRNPMAAATLSIATGLAAITLGVTYGQPLIVLLLPR